MSFSHHQPWLLLVEEMLELTDKHCRNHGNELGLHLNVIVAVIEAVTIVLSLRYRALDVMTADLFLDVGNHCGIVFNKVNRLVCAIY